MSVLFQISYTTSVVVRMVGIDGRALARDYSLRRRRRRSLPSKKALMFRVFHALLPLPHALLPRPLMISTRNF